MLRIIFLDIAPYIIDDEQLKIITWNALMHNETIDNLLVNNQALKKLFLKRKSLFKNQNIYLDVTDVKVYDELVKQWNEVYLHALNDYIQNQHNNENLIKLFNDANNNNVKIVFTTNNSNMLNLKDIFASIIKYNNVEFYKINNFSNFTADMIIDYASQFNVTFDEIAVITQSKESIEDLVNHNIFTMTVNGSNEMITNNFASLESNDSINMKQILYFYYEYKKNNNAGI